MKLYNRVNRASQVQGVTTIYFTTPALCHILGIIQRSNDDYCPTLSVRFWDSSWTFNTYSFALFMLIALPMGSQIRSTKFGPNM